MEDNYYEKNIVSKLASDAKFVGILNIIVGVINCLTITGIITGVITIITGLKAKEAGEHFSNYSALNDEAEEYRALESLGAYFKWLKITIIVGVVVFIIGMLISFAMGSFSSGYKY